MSYIWIVDIHKLNVGGDLVFLQLNMHENSDGGWYSHYFVKTGGYLVFCMIRVSVYFLQLIYAFSYPLYGFQRGMFRKLTRK